MCFKKENEIFKENYPTDADEIKYYTDKVEYIFREIGIATLVTESGKMSRNGIARSSLYSRYCGNTKIGMKKQKRLYFCATKLERQIK